MIAQMVRLVDMTRVTCADDTRHTRRGTLSYGFMRRVTIPLEWIPVSSKRMKVRTMYVYLRKTARRGKFDENNFIQIQLVHDRPFYVGLLLWRRAARGAGSTQAKQYTKTDQNPQANE